MDQLRNLSAFAASTVAWVFCRSAALTIGSVLVVVAGAFHFVLRRTCGSQRESSTKRPLTDMDWKFNWTKHQKDSTKGHYESFFQRANHPTKPLAFWIRYTIFSPAGAPEKAIGELWAVWFDGEMHQHTAVKKEVPLSQCMFAQDRFEVRIDTATLQSGELKGDASSANGKQIAWDLTYKCDSEPLFDLPMALYAAPLPKAKILVGAPLARYSGSITVGSENFAINEWVGSQNHNWGPKHTDYYAWGQVAGFDGCPNSFLEAATAQLKIGPVWTPMLTIFVLRIDDKEYAFNALLRSVGKGKFKCFDWEFANENSDVAISGRIFANREDFVGLNYYNPPGGSKACLNSKIASCEVTVVVKNTGAMTKLVSRNRAAFEILTDDKTTHGVEIRA